MINRIIILGHTGFIGTHLERSLTKNYPSITVIGKSLPAVDLAEDASLLHTYFNEETAVVMCAAVKKQQGDSLENFQKNVAMVTNVAKVLEHSPVGRFLYFSSAAVYGEHKHNLNITEDTKIDPTSYYGIAKYASEKIFQKAMPHNLIIIRPPLIYGPGDQPGYGPSGFISAARDHKIITLWGDGTEKREFMYVEDVVKIVEQLLFSAYTNILNIASGNSYTYLEIIDLIRSATGYPHPIISRERTQPKVDHQFNNDRFKTIFPTFTFTPLSFGVQKMLL